MDDKKVCFIMCVNDEQYAQEAIYYISRLNVPEGYAIDMLSVQDAVSMTAGYNEAMAASDAKYKVYLHQDVMIVELDFIVHLLEIFRDPKIGMIGMVGATRLPENAVMWYSPRVGKIYSGRTDQTRHAVLGEVSGAYQEVEAVDGLLMATQYDVRWREDVFDQWDFYDVSQSLEFRKKGYKVVVPGMERPWVIHDSGFVDYKNYYGERKKFLKEYGLAREQTISNDKITLVVTMCNQRKILENCLEWICNLPEIHQVIFVDNGSSDGSAELLPQGLDSIVFEDKQGYGVLWNAVVGKFQLDDVIVFMDVQYMLGRKSLKELCHILQSEQVGIAGPRSNGCSGCQFVEMDGMDAMLNMETQTAADAGAWSVVGLDAGIWAISRQVLEAVGGFRQDLLLPQNVLLDYELRMIQKGYHPVICQTAFAFFIKAKQDETLDFDEKKDRDILKQQWDMNYFNRIPNRNLTAMIKAEKNEAFQVLEVGCDLGATLLDIKNHYPNSKIHGLEINPAAVGIAAYLADVREGNIEEEQVPFQEKFDYILFGDVLEHLRDPQKTVRFCKENLLKKHGKIIASIPNLMHISVMQQLLQGRFEYADMGLLDRTHIHFFTFYEIINMFQSEGFSIEEIHTTRFPLNPEQKRLIEKLLELSKNVELHMYETVQYLIRAGGTDEQKSLAESEMEEERFKGETRPKQQQNKQYREKLRELQKLIDRASRVSYHGVYLWKYIEYEIVSGMDLNIVNPEKNIAWKPQSDEIPKATPAQIETVDRLLNGLEKKEVLFVSVPLRRLHNGKLVHTAMDAYPDVLEEESYLVLERGEWRKDLYTRNIRCWDFWGVVGKYGQDSVDKQELMNFLRKEYIEPIQMKFDLVYPEQALMVCFMKLSWMLKVRKAYISFWNEVLKRVKPKVVCYTHGAAVELCFVREAAMQKAIPTVEIFHGEGIENITHQKTLALSDYMLTHSDLITNPMKNRGHKNIFTIGKPGIYDNIIHHRAEDGPIVISVISSLEQELLRWTLNLAEKLEGRPYLVVYKRHGSEAWTEDEMRQVAQRHRNWKFVGGEVDVRTLYEVSDLVIGVRSSGIFDALSYYKIKILAIEDDDGKDMLLWNVDDLLQHMDELGDIVMVHDEEQLYQEVVNYERGRDYRGRTNHYWPADSEKRFREFIQIFLDGKRPRA